MARKKRYTAAEVVAMLRETKGMVYLAAERLGCSHTTVYNYIKNYVSVKEEFEHQRGELVDIMELKLREAALSGEPWAVQFGLRTIGKHRGYVERSEQEITGKDGGPIPVQVIGIGGINPDDDI